MRKIFFALLLVGSASLLTAACGDTLVQKYANARGGYNVAVESMIELRREGLCNDTCYAKATPLIEEGDRALDGLRDAALANNDSKFRRLRIAVISVGGSLAALYTQYVKGD